MSKIKRKRSSYLFYGIVCTGLVLWIFATGSSMSNVVNLQAIIPIVTVLVALLVPPRPAFIMLFTLAIQLLNLSFFDYSEQWSDVWMSGGWFSIIGIIAGNIAVVGIVSWRMRLKRTTIRSHGAKIQGIVLKIIAIILFLISMIIVLVLRSGEISHDVEIFYITLFVTLILAGFLWYRGKQYKSIAKKEVLKNDHRPPVLYLRSFTSDESVWLESLAFLINPEILGRGHEEQLADIVSPIGPLLAVGKPGEDLPSLGADKVYVGDQNWKFTVEEIMKDAQLIIIRIKKGGTGIWWEIERAFDLVPPGKLLLLFMLGKKQHREAFNQIRKMNRFENFPESCPMFSFLWYKSSSDFEVLQLKAPFWRTSLFKSLKARYHYAFCPVFKSLGIPWTPLPISFSRIAVTLPGLLVIIFIIIMLVFA